jgi:hypothetical protein
MTRVTSSDARTGATVAFHVHIRKGERGRRRMRKGAPKPPKPVELGHIPRISRLMALAIHYDGLIRKGIMRDYAEIARLGGVSRARVSQIMDLLNLAPEIQEEILFLPRVVGKEEVTERQTRPVVTQDGWEAQMKVWSTFPSLCGVQPAK